MKKINLKYQFLPLKDMYLIFMYITFIPFHSLHQIFTKKFVDQCDDTWLYDLLSYSVAFL